MRVHPAAKSYLEYQFVSPQMLAEAPQNVHGVDDSVVLCVGVLLSADYEDINPLKNAREKARRVNEAILEFTAGDTMRERYVRAIGSSWQFTHCAGCGYDFRATTCRGARHKVRFHRNIYVATGPRSYLPPRVADFAQQRGHKFIYRPPRP